MHRLSLSHALVVTMLTTSVIHADPIIHFKNNSDRAIAVAPLGQLTMFDFETIKPNDDHAWESIWGESSLRGLRVKYGPASFDFLFDAPGIKKYYVKLTDKDGIPSLAPQSGNILGKSSNLKYSLSGNIKESHISKAKPVK